MENKGTIICMYMYDGTETNFCSLAVLACIHNVLYGITRAASSKINGTDLEIIEGAESFLTASFSDDDDEVCAPVLLPTLLVLFRSGELLVRCLEDVLSFGDSSSVISPSLLDLCTCAVL